MNKSIRKDFCNCILVALHNSKAINEVTYKQAQSKLKKEKGKEVA